jgi:hypothetical protein
MQNRLMQKNDIICKDIFMELYVIIPSEVTQKYIQHHIMELLELFSDCERIYMLVRMDSVSSQ